MNLLFFSKPKAKYYVSIHDCTISVFNIILKTKDYSKVCYEGKLKEDEAFETWIKIYSEFIKEFGTPDEYKEYIQIRKKWAAEQVNIWIKGQEYRKSIAEMYRRQYEAIMLTPDEDNFSKTIGIVSKEMGFRVDPTVVTVYEFYGYKNLIEENVKEARK